MRIVYLDESGISEKEPAIVVAGVIVHGDHQLNKLRSALKQIMDRHIPVQDRGSLVLHATDIYGGNRYFDEKRKPEWTYERRMAILADLAKVPTAINLRITCGRVERAKFPQAELRVENPAHFLRLAVGAAYMSCLIEVEQWFRQNARSENCFIVAEDNRDTRQFIKEVHQHHQGVQITELLCDRERQYFPLRHIHEDPNFQEKRVAHPLVLADFIAYFMKRRLAGDERSLQFSDPWISLTAGLHVKLPPL